MSYGTSREERIRELPGLIAAACGGVVRTAIAAEKARENLLGAEEDRAKEAERHNLLVNELAGLVMTATHSDEPKKDDE